MSAVLPVIHILLMGLLPCITGFEAKTARDELACDPAQPDTCSACAALELVEKLDAKAATCTAPKVKTPDAKNRTQATSWCQPVASRDCSTGKTWQLVATNLLQGVRVRALASPAFVDLDGDGDQDLVVGDRQGMLQYFERMDDGTFLQHTGADNPLHALSVEFQAAPTFIDLDGDGDQDIVVGGDSYKLKYFERMPNITFLERTGADNPFHALSVKFQAAPTFADLDGDGDQDLVVGDGSGHLRYFEHVPNNTFLERAGADANPLHALRVDYSAAPVFVDLDGDGDQDLVVGERSGHLKYFERLPDGTFLGRIGADVNPVHAVHVKHLASPTFVDLDDDGHQDLVVGEGSGELQYFERMKDTTFLERIGADANPLHAFRVADRAAPVLVDLDGDGDQDVVVGDESGRLRYFEHTSDATFLERTGAGANPLHAVDVGKNAVPTFVDLDGDGDQDLVVGDAFGGLAYIERMPGTTFRRRTGAGANPFYGFRVGGGQFHDYEYAAPTFVDLDGDGDQDLVVGDAFGMLNYFERMPNATFLERAGPGANPLHAVRVNSFAVPTFVDLDGDGDQDLVIGDRYGELFYFERMPDASFLRRTGTDANPLHGFRIGSVSYPAPTFGDIDGDGNKELVVGESTGKLKYLQRGHCVPHHPCSGNGVCRHFSCTCLQGYMGDTKVGTECFYCSAGYEPVQRAGRQMGCRPCGPGTSSAGHLARCAACAKGKYAGSEGDICSACTPGKIPSSNQTSCEDCPIGKVASPTFTCDECLQGRVVARDGTRCEDCPAGTRWLEVNKTCEDCPAGRHSSAGRSSCTECLPGWYSLRRSEDCATCKTGEVPGPLKDGCKACQFGRSAKSGDSHCEPNPFLCGALMFFALLLFDLTYFMWRRLRAARELGEAMNIREVEKKLASMGKKMSDKGAHATPADMLKQAIENGYRWRIWKSMILKAEAELLKQERKYMTFEAFLDIVQDGDIKLLRGSWLAKKGNIDRFRRRQDTKKEAFWEVNELRSQIQLVHFVIISYCWLHPVNPDPESKHLELIQHALRKRLEVSGEGQVQDIAIIIDYLSLAQHGEDTGEKGELRSDPRQDPEKKRTAEEERQFSRGLGLLNIPYAHKQVQVWLMKWTPEDHPKYMDRGWPYFEQAVAGLIKDTTKLVLLQREALNCESWDDIYNTFKKSADGSLQRIPPLLPSAFEEEIKKRKFTNGKNPQDFVAGLYKRTFTEVIGNAEVLWFVDLAWGNNNATNLADILCECKRLKQLLVCNNPIGKPGALALVTAASNCATLELLDMTGNAMSEGECEEVKVHARRMTLELRVDGKMLEAIDDSEVVVVEERRKTRVQEIEMSVIPGARARTRPSDTGARASSSSGATLALDGGAPLLEDV